MLKQRLLNSVSTSILRVGQAHTTAKSNDKISQSNPIPVDSKRQRNAAVLIENRISVPHLTSDLLKMIETTEPKYITRHFNKNGVVDGQTLRLRELVLSGSYHFRTLHEYRSFENNTEGRLGDTLEGVQSDIYAGDGNIYTEQVSFTDNYVDPSMDSLVIKCVINDYCSCASYGDYSNIRALKMADKEKKNTIDYYVVYDFHKLKVAINSILTENESTAGLIMISRKVNYEYIKNRLWTVVDQLHHKAERNNLKLWLDTAFTKSSIYRAEEEYRLVICNPSQAGNLSDTNGLISWIDQRIANAIVRHGPIERNS